ncbi:MAG TPA: DegT/DnrJ/EryC1/StrS family aminotransferase [Prolixibacteraceae bacterium]|jgi:dTDP-4-amino-4,6-dideoxygalactose transaminase|nr:DegT/DnrJ/EryC1/StrS family aminotransferase [Prolixibacteraceae bacterium]HOG96603.1 DegT/DnrJ/EryC1/StrS family aminotransferase [Prolixibacteraceae bacterium]HQB27338.1 DegT/DnrJ/EryC1/StrS family aminotransferase [Paludibacter sp.]
MPIYVAQPSLPPLDEFSLFLEQIWESKWLTNQGPFHEIFEKELADYLGVKYISLFANGTLALITALQALGISGDAITTPFSFVATTHSLIWNKINPIFVDIEQDYLTLDPTKIEAAITPNSSVILPVHVYGNPCKIAAIQNIANKHGLKVIYDAAHAFGVKLDGKSILLNGDLSILSFHATKVFSTIEGGAIVCHDEKMKHHIDNLRNFGFQDETVVEEPGINAKMNEIQSAFGLLQLKYVDEYIKKRRIIVNTYTELLKGLSGLRVLRDMKNVNHNFSYFPILVDEDRYGLSRDELYFKLRENEIFGRRYFYPLISNFPMYSDLPSASINNLPIANNLSQQVICLPIYPDLDLEIVKRIAGYIKGYHK